MRNFKCRIVFAIIALSACARSTPAAPETKPEMVLQIGHDGWLDELTVSDDAALLASHSQTDGYIKIWNAEGVLLCSIAADSNETPLVFSPDAKVLLCSLPTSETEIFTLRGRAVPTGEKTIAFEGTASKVTAFSEDGARLLAVSQNSIVTWDTRTGKRIGNVALKSPPQLLSRSRFDFSFDRRLIVGNDGMNGKVRVWETASGKLLKLIVDKKGVMASAAVSSNGKYLVTEGENLTWKPPQQNASRGRDAFSRRLTIRLWNLQTGKTLKIWEGFDVIDGNIAAGGAQLLRFTSDDRALLIAGEGRVEAREIPSGKSLWRFNDTDDIFPGWPFAASRNGQLLIGSDSNSSVPKIHLWNAKTGRARIIGQNFAEHFQQLLFSPDGSTLAVGYPVSLWDMKSTQLTRSLANTEYNRHMTFLPQGRFATGADGAHIWDLASGEMQKKLYFPGYSDGVLVSPHGKFFVGLGDGNGPQAGVLYLWSVETKKRLSAIEHFVPRTAFYTGKGETWFAWYDLKYARWLPDGNRLLFPHTDGMRLWNLRSGKVERTFSDPKNAKSPILPLAVSSDGKVVAGQTTRNDAILIWNVQDGQLRSTVAMRGVVSTSLSPDGNSLAVSEASSLRVYNTRSTTSGDAKESFVGAKLLYTQTLSGEYERAVAFSPNGKHIVVTGQATQIRNANNGRLILSFIILEKPELSIQPASWIAFTPEGFYTGSKDCEKFIRWRVGDKLLLASEYSARFRRPDLISKALLP